MAKCTKIRILWAKAKTNFVNLRDVQPLSIVYTLSVARSPQTFSTIDQRLEPVTQILLGLQ